MAAFCHCDFFMSVTAVTPLRDPNQYVPISVAAGAIRRRAQHPVMTITALSGGPPLH